jgi:hypothetical protein
MRTMAREERDAVNRNKLEWTAARELFKEEIEKAFDKYNGPEQMSLDLLMAQLMGPKVKAESEAYYLGIYD